MNIAERLQQAIDKGQAVLRTHTPNPPGIIGFPTLDTGQFNAWRAQASALIRTVCGAEHDYTQAFTKTTEYGAYTDCVNSGIGILTAVLEEVQAGHLGSPEGPAETNTLKVLTNLCDRFHGVARQLRQRREDRPTLDISDEYDVQDLMHALLRLHFDDIRAEEWTPSYAGGSSRVDFLLKAQSVVLEMKKTRRGLNAKELGEQLIIDIDRYRAHPGCQALICFVYDPDGYIRNPRGVEQDLQRDQPFVVRVFIRPE